MSGQARPCGPVPSWQAWPQRRLGSTVDDAGNCPQGRDPAWLFRLEVAHMTTVELLTRSCGGYAVAALRGELDTTGAEAVVGALTVLAADGQQLIIDLEALDFIDCHAAGALLG